MELEESNRVLSLSLASEGGSLEVTAGDALAMVVGISTENGKGLPPRVVREGLTVQLVASGLLGLPLMLLSPAWRLCLMSCPCSPVSQSLGGVQSFPPRMLILCAIGSSAQQIVSRTAKRVRMPERRGRVGVGIRYTCGKEVSCSGFSVPDREDTSRLILRCCRGLDACGSFAPRGAGGRRCRSAGNLCSFPVW